MNNRSFIWSLGVMLVSLAFVCQASANNRIAKVGEYRNGEIHLDEESLLKESDTGQRLHRYQVLTVGGFYHLSRERGDGDDCQNEKAPLVDRDGQKLVPGMDPGMRFDVYISEVLPLLWFNCLDDGCKNLEGAVIGQNPPIDGADCRRTQASNFNCACHLKRGNDRTVVPNGNLCRVGFVWLPLDLDDWVMGDSIGTIPN